MNSIVKLLSPECDFVGCISPISHTVSRTREKYGTKNIMNKYTFHKIKGIRCSQFYYFINSMPLTYRIRFSRCQNKKKTLRFSNALFILWRAIDCHEQIPTSPIICYFMDKHNNSLFVRLFGTQHFPISFIAVKMSISW